MGYQDHPLRKNSPTLAAAVTLETGCVLGAHAVTLPAVLLGERCFVAERAGVTEKVPPNRLIVGIPARLVGTLG
ncbi:MAG: hypothetical protein ABI565_11295 [Vicinamibacteria bacterium]